MKKKIISVALLMTLLISVVFAGDGEIKAYLKNFTIQLNGKVLDLKDANGNEITPIIVNGTTYLPVRALSNNLGLNVTWDSSTETISLVTQNEPEVFSRDLRELAEREAINRALVGEVKIEWTSVNNFGRHMISVESLKKILNREPKNTYSSVDESYVEVYAFYERDLAGIVDDSNFIYIMDEFTDEFMNLENGEATFNGIRAIKKDGKLYFHYEDLKKYKITD